MRRTATCWGSLGISQTALWWFNLRMCLFDDWLVLVGQGRCCFRRKLLLLRDRGGHRHLGWLLSLGVLFNEIICIFIFFWILLCLLSLTFLSVMWQGTCCLLDWFRDAVLMLVRTTGWGPIVVDWLLSELLSGFGLMVLIRYNSAFCLIILLLLMLVVFFIIVVVGIVVI